MQSKKHKLVFQPQGIQVEVEHGQQLRTAAHAAGVEIRSLCGERVNCGKCRVVVQSGSYEQYGIQSNLDHLSVIEESEAAYWARRKAGLAAQGIDPHALRLACQARVLGDVVVMVPESSRAVQQVVRKAARARPVEIHPNVKKLYVELSPATLDDPEGDWERLKAALAAAEALTFRTGDLPLQVDHLTIDLPALLDLQRAIRDGDWSLTTTVWGGCEVVRVESGYEERLVGLAVDIGTTTLAAHLCDLHSGELLATADMMNPQIAFGEDIMSRISYASEAPNGLESLHNTLVKAVDSLARRACQQAGIRASEIIELVVVGNSVMHHLFLGLDPTDLGRAPYIPAVKGPLDLRARELGLVSVNPGGKVHLLPLIASFVGADCTAVILAEAPHEQDENWLIVDVGTNAELVLGNRERMLCTSTPTGPAFEGAHIEHGMRAARGAIERVLIDDQTRRAQVKVVGNTEWSGTPGIAPLHASGICGSGIIDAVAELYRTGIVKADGLFTDEDLPNLRKTGSGSMEYVLVDADQTTSGQEITVTQEDIRQLQLAKAPLYVAAHFLLKRLGLERPDRILLAGGFGTHIDPIKAMLVGMIPDCPLDVVHSVGNSAGDGALIGLLNWEKRRSAAVLVRDIHRIELPAQSRFQDQFFLALHFPHMVDPFPNLVGIAPLRVPDPIAKELFGDKLPGWENP